MLIKMMRTIIVSVHCLVIFYAGQVLAADQHSTIKIDGIPYSASAPKHVAYQDGALSFSATKGTDLFTSAAGKTTANTPKVLFEPKGDFVFSAKVSPIFNKAYDGGALILYGNEKHWAKLLFEQLQSGEYGIASTISRNVGDDVYHPTFPNKPLYLKIARKEKLYVFYSSVDGEKWQMLRNFGLEFDKPLKVGFSIQSPIGDKHTATFSDIRFEAKTFKDFWQGE